MRKSTLIRMLFIAVLLAIGAIPPAMAGNNYYRGKEFVPDYEFGSDKLWVL